MSLPSLCIKRPVFTTMLILLPVVLGVIALMNMGLGLFPNVDLPIINVTVNRPGASAEEMETGVTELLEEEINTVSEIDELRSTTSEGRTNITVIFKLSKNTDTAFQEVQSRVSRLVSRLPEGTDAPIIDKFDVDATPVMTVAVSSGKRELRELTEIADNDISDAISSLPGVGSVSIAGGQKRAIQVTVDAKKLEAYGLAIDNVRTALAKENVEVPGGRVEQSRREMVLRTLGRVTDPAQIADIIVANRDGQAIRIRDLGGAQIVRDSVEQPRSMTRLDGTPAVVMIVQKQGGSNTVDVIDTVKAKLNELGGGFKNAGRDDIKLEIIKDQSRFIKASLHEVQIHLILGAILVVLTIIAFLRDWRATIIAAVAIPASLLAAFPVMQAFNLTIDNITLIALVLVIGIVIDDAVIVIENIVRWMEEKKLSPMEAAVEGTKEITLAVVATTLSLAVIFAPIAMLGGQVGRFLRSFGITAAVCILVSLFVSLTLTPMLSSRLLRKPKHPADNIARRKRFDFYGWLIEQPYLGVLRASMRFRWLIVVVALACIGAIIPLFGMVGKDFIPKDDQSEFEITFNAPEGWTLERSSETARQIETRIKAFPEVKNVLTQIGDSRGRAARGEGSVNRGNIYVRIEDIADRKPKYSQFDVMARARKVLKDFPDLRSAVAVPRPLSGTGNSNYDVEFILAGPDLDKLRAYSTAIVAKLRSTPGIADADTTLPERKPEVHVRIDRERASDQGVSIAAAASTLRTLVGGEIASDYKDADTGDTYDVWLRAEGVDRGDPAAIGNLKVPGSGGRLVPLASIATPEEGLGPAQIDRASRQRKISIVANLAGMPVGEASALIVQAFKEQDAPATYSIGPTGSAKNFAAAIGAFFLAFAFSLLLMYMVLAAQFESFLHPVTILLAVPLTIPFALVSQLLFGNALSLFSVLGLFLLFGIVKKNGILQVDYTNTLRTKLKDDPGIVPFPYGGIGEPKSGWDRWVLSLSKGKRERLWAVLEANRVRLRPILMTTIMLVAAMIPIALGKGPGSANRADMAKIIIGGQALSLLLSLLVTPVAYSLFADAGAFFSRKKPPADSHPD
jgi:HAE1 family hydrophobic/amphiphilic exporter-1